MSSTAKIDVQGAKIEVPGWKDEDIKALETLSPKVQVADQKGHIELSFNGAYQEGQVIAELKDSNLNPEQQLATWQAKGALGMVEGGRKIETSGDGVTLRELSTEEKAVQAQKDEAAEKQAAVQKLVQQRLNGDYADLPAKSDKKKSDPHFTVDKAGKLSFKSDLDDAGRQEGILRAVSKKLEGDVGYGKFAARVAAAEFLAKHDPDAALKLVNEGKLAELFPKDSSKHYENEYEYAAKRALPNGTEEELKAFQGQLQEKFKHVSTADRQLALYGQGTDGFLKGEDYKRHLVGSEEPKKFDGSKVSKEFLTDPTTKQLDNTAHEAIVKSVQENDTETRREEARLEADLRKAMENPGRFTAQQLQDKTNALMDARQKREKLEPFLQNGIQDLAGLEKYNELLTKDLKKPVISITQAMKDQKKALAEKAEAADRNVFENFGHAVADQFSSEKILPTLTALASAPTAVISWAKGLHEAVTNTEARDKWMQTYGDKLANSTKEMLNDFNVGGKRREGAKSLIKGFDEIATKFAQKKENAQNSPGQVLAQGANVAGPNGASNMFMPFKLAKQQAQQPNTPTESEQELRDLKAKKGLGSIIA